MPNGGALEWVAILIIICLMIWLFSYLITKSLPGAFRQIRQWWYDAKPDDHTNHR